MECPICLCSLSQPPEEPQAKRQRLNEDSVAEAPKSEVCCTPCGHLFHKSCLISWISPNRSQNVILRFFSSVKGSCPNCRSEFPLDQLRSVYVEPEEPSKEVRDLKAEVERERERASRYERKLERFMKDSGSPSFGVENSGSSEDEASSEGDSSDEEDSEATDETEEDSVATDETEEDDDNEPEDDEGDVNEIQEDRYEHENACSIF